jgi:hypothetical protein
VSSGLLLSKHQANDLTVDDTATQQSVNKLIQSQLDRQEVYYKVVEKRIQKKQQQTKKNYDKNINNIQLNIGTVVLVRTPKSQKKNNIKAWVKKAGDCETSLNILLFYYSDSGKMCI